MAARLLDFPGQLTGAPLKRGVLVDVLGELTSHFPGQLTGAPLKLQMPSEPFPKLPDFPGQLTGAPLKRAREVPRSSRGTERLGIGLRKPAIQEV